jgi:hypothetical protein
MFINVDWPDSKVDSACVRVSELFRTEFLETTMSISCKNSEISKKEKKLKIKFFSFFEISESLFLLFFIILTLQTLNSINRIRLRQNSSTFQV